MTALPEQEQNWELGTWKGSRRRQHQDFYALPFAKKLELIEELAEIAAQLGRARKRAADHFGSAGTASPSNSVGG
ncbi:MAG: hypothetical protein NZ739_00145 [Verrucomicrobiae bacterium]|nr:hypothetical protein [Verrucomicrobiae bacterium]MCX7722299.1 hypothetical protein [Verrucomicrobiae bacterium]MDW7980518.1 hypothetical protein [Verrucomicrobiales bacterium]